jgi:hypothetical protein
LFLSFEFPQQNPICISLHPHALHMPIPFHQRWLVTLTEIVPLSSPFRPTLWSTQLPIQRVPRFFPWGKGAGAWNWLFTSIYCRGWDRVEMEIFSIKFLFGFVLIWIFFITRNVQHMCFMGVVGRSNHLVKERAVQKR